MPINEDTIRAYQQLVNSKADAKSPEILPNAGKKHAAIAMAKLLEKTTHSAKMVVGSFSGDVCDQPNYLESLQKSIDRNVEFKIIFLDQRNTDATSYKMLLEAQKAGKNIQFKDSSISFKNQLSTDGKPKHFAIFDDNKFRFETDTEKFIAWFSFNDEANAKKLSRVFYAAF